jgi:MFS superfamily sulfate permease-like transporter
LFYANEGRFAEEVRMLVETAPAPVRWFVIDAGAMTNIDYSAAKSLRELCDDFKQRGINFVFGRVNVYLRADMDRHGISAAIGEQCIYLTLHEALAFVGVHETVE